MMVTLRLAVETLEQRDDLLAGLQVEVAGGLVGQDDGGVVGEGPGDGDALLLAAGELEGLVAVALPEADLLEQLHALQSALVVGHAGEDHRQGHVLQRAS